MPVSVSPINKLIVDAPVTVVASLIVTVTVTTSPALSLLFAAPVALVISTLLTVGGVVSRTAGVLDEAPAAAANPSAPTAIRTPETDAAPAAAAPAPAVAVATLVVASAAAVACGNAACASTIGSISTKPADEPLICSIPAAFWGAMAASNASKSAGKAAPST